MFERLTHLFPPALLAGLAIYGGVCFLWLQPMVERRLAARNYIPACERGLLVAAKARDNRQRQAEDDVGLLLDMLRQTPFGQIPGAMEPVERMGEYARRKARLPERTIDHSSLCACAVGTAFAGQSLPMLLHVMSGRTYRPASLDNLPGDTARALRSGTCTYAGT
ncbi:hypothetical protein [Jiella mangrovi]|uniref:Pilus assembly protein n=1 Tax=Jiella mangrovi TaxID=2821407 RepID=A0ABS4BDI9_9HYPH|nr:hypothetical protein [Jiella mangrovi]MBP0614241.1 hypothetical protein [Jiella mangrovi]